MELGHWLDQTEARKSHVPGWQDVHPPDAGDEQGALRRPRPRARAPRSPGGQVLRRGEAGVPGTTRCNYEWHGKNLTNRKKSWPKLSALEPNFSMAMT